MKKTRRANDPMTVLVSVFVDYLDTNTQQKANYRFRYQGQHYCGFLIKTKFKYAKKLRKALHTYTHRVKVARLVIPGCRYDVDDYVINRFDGKRNIQVNSKTPIVLNESNEHLFKVYPIHKNSSELNIKSFFKELVNGTLANKEESTDGDDTKSEKIVSADKYVEALESKMSSTKKTVSKTVKKENEENQNEAKDVGTTKENLFKGDKEEKTLDSDASSLLKLLERKTKNTADNKDVDESTKILGKKVAQLAIHFQKEVMKHINNKVDTKLEKIESSLKSELGIDKLQLIDTLDKRLTTLEKSVSEIIRTLQKIIEIVM